MLCKLVLAFLFSTATSGFSSRLSPRCRQSVFIFSAKVEKTREEWKTILDDESFRVLRDAGTEQPFTSVLNNVENTDVGTFICKGCGAKLFPAAAKYDSGTGWPSFVYPVNNDAIEYQVDFAAIVPRVECRCSSCGGHLGHVFEDGPQPTGLRYCMNGIAMSFSETEPSSMDAVKVKLPLYVALPGVLLNFSIAGLFWVSFVNHGMPPANAGTLAQASAAFPLPIVAYYLYNAVFGLLRSNLV